MKNLNVILITSLLLVTLNGYSKVNLPSSTTIIKKEDTPPVKRILVLEGGGFRGVYTAATLAFIEMKTGKPITELVDATVGTSTGGLLSLMIAKGMRATEALNVYLDNGDEIFGSKQHTWKNYLSFGLAGSKYSTKGLMTVMQREMGDLTLHDLDIPVAVTAVNKKTNQTELLNSEDDLYSSLNVFEAARATSAAPTYFKSIDLTLHNGDTRTYVDGGVNTNSATLEAYRFIKQLDPENKYRWEMLSIGTASAKLPEISDGGLAAGLFNGLVDNLYNNSEKDTVNFAAYLMQNEYKDRHSFMRIDMTPDKKIPMDSVDDKTMNQLLSLAQTQYEQENSSFTAVVNHLIHQ